MKTKQLDITREEANEVLGGLAKQYLQNLVYHYFYLEQQEDKEKFTYRTMEIAKILLFYMDEIAEFLHLDAYVVNIDKDTNVRIDLYNHINRNDRKPTVQRVQELLDLIGA